MTAGLAERLRGRSEEIEQAILTRVRALEDPAQRRDPAYAEGLRTTVADALAYALEAIERSESRPAPIPMQLFVQARRAAREGVSLDTVLRRYLAGYSLLGDFLHQEAAQADLLGAPAFQRLRRDQAALLDRLLAAISQEYGREADSARLSSAERRSELVRRILAGELLDGEELGYELALWHLGAIAFGEGAEEALRELARSLDCRSLIVAQAEGQLWAWLGSREAIASAEAAHLATELLPKRARLVLGEPGVGVGGWRFSHRQAARAWPLTEVRNERVIRYGEVALLASLLQDEVLATSLRELYLAPLDSDRDDGPVLRETLRAYLAAGRNVSSTASVLAVSRRTVTKRICRAEERLGRPIGSCAAEIEAALRVQQARDQGSRDETSGRPHVSH